MTWEKRKNMKKRFLPDAVVDIRSEDIDGSNSVSADMSNSGGMVKHAL